MYTAGEKPQWLYEALPLVYLAGGVLVATSLHNFAGIGSGLMLMSAGTLVSIMRWNYRRGIENAPDENRAAAVANPETHEPSVTRLHWRASFEVGHAVIDRQHEQLFALSNQLINDILENKSRGHIESLLDDLIVDITNHFQTEERIMTSRNTPLSRGHAQMHTALVERIRDLQSSYHCRALPASDLVRFLAYDVIAQHIVTEDLRFSDSRF